MPSGRSILGVNLSHTLVDAASCSKLLHDLSFLYVNPGKPLPNPPTFFARVTYPSWPPSIDTLTKWHFSLLDPVTPDMAGEAYVKAMGASEAVTVYVTAKDFEGMRNDCRIIDGSFLSNQDVLSGWWVKLIESLGEESTRSLRYAINVSDCADYPAKGSIVTSILTTVHSLQILKICSLRQCKCARSIFRQMTAWKEPLKSPQPSEKRLSD